MSDFSERIEKAAAARQAEWSKGNAADHGEVQRLTGELNSLWREQRSRGMSSAGGRVHIVKRARVELELERLAPDPQNESDA